jgi:hypothetical protein
LAAQDEFDETVVNSDLRLVVEQLVSLLRGPLISEATTESAAGVPE